PPAEIYIDRVEYSDLDPESADERDNNGDERQQDRSTRALAERRRDERVQEVDDQVDDDRDREEPPEELRVETPRLAENPADGHATHPRARRRELQVAPADAHSRPRRRAAPRRTSSARSPTQRSS